MKLTVQNSLKTVQLFQAFIYQGLNYQIIDVIQLNRAKFIFNRSKKENPNVTAITFGLDMKIRRYGSLLFIGHWCNTIHLTWILYTFCNLKTKEKPTLHG